MASRPDDLCAIIPSLNAADTIAEVVRATREYVAEVLVVDEAIQNMILKKEAANVITRHAVESGQLTTMKENAVEKIKRESQP